MENQIIEKDPTDRKVTTQDTIDRWVKEGDPNVHLNLSYMDLTELPPIPHNVRKLDCSNNKLTKLKIPDKITCVTCNNNQLIELIIPNSCDMLKCDNNKLKELTLPPNIRSLSCCSNQLTELVIPDSIEIFYWWNNPIEYPPIDILNESLYDIKEWIKENPITFTKSARKL